jgi:hypothetical protein
MIPFILDNFNNDSKMQLIVISLFLLFSLFAMSYVSPLYAGNVQLTMDNDRIINVPPTST